MAQAQAQSPYVAGSGAVGELGQPRVSPQAETDRPSGGISSEGTNYTDRGLHASKDQQHLQATDDTNIGHGHEPFSSTTGSGYVAAPEAGPEARQHKGMGEKMKNAVKGVKDVVTGHKEAVTPGAKTPGFTDKLKDTVTGQKPGQGAAAGYATSGSAVPGEEDYAGRTRPGTGGLNQKVDTPGVGEEDYAGRTIPGTGGLNQKVDTPGVGEQHHSGWPQPVPPQGMQKPNVVSPSDATSGGYGSSAPSYGTGEPTGDRLYGSGVDYLPDHGKKPVDGSENLGGGHLQQNDLSGTKYVGDSADAPHHSSHRNEYPDADRVGDKAPNVPVGGGHLPGQHSDFSEGNAKPVGGQGFGGSSDTAPNVPVGGDHLPDHHSDFSEIKPVGGGTAQGSSGGTGNLQSTPPELDARHDTPTVDNAGGAEYTDSAGRVHQEGPRDDNVKKEGLMAKMMDKLHLSSNKHKDSSTSPTNI